MKSILHAFSFFARFGIPLVLSIQLVLNPLILGPLHQLLLMNVITTILHHFLVHNKIRCFIHSFYCLLMILDYALILLNPIITFQQLTSLLAFIKFDELTSKLFTCLNVMSFAFLCFLHFFNGFTKKDSHLYCLYP